MKNRPLLAAYYFPNWHVDPRNEKLHGKNWTEWNVTRCAMPRFEGHIQPKVPLWGYGDEAEPEVMEEKIDAAITHGVDAFIFDWYYFQSGPYRQRCIEEGFLKAKNVNKIKFAIMWANHDPVLSHPRAYKTPADHNPWTGALTPETFRASTDRCLKNFLCQPNYLRIDGKLYFELYRPQPFVSDVGGMKIAKELILDFRAKVSQAGLGELLLVGNMAGIKVEKGGTFDEANHFATELGLDQISVYGACPEDKYFPTVDYYQWQQERVIPDMDFFNAGLQLPFNPNISVGWDSSPRTVQSESYEGIGYPFCTVTINDTPEQLEKVLNLYKERFETGIYRGRVLSIACWNEWTEGSYIEPDRQYGFGRLEAIKKVFGAKIAE